MTDDARFERLLLGMLSEDEIDALNDDAIADDEVATRLAMLEDEMIDAYVRDELDDASKARLETTLLRTEYGRERVALARALTARADRVDPEPRATVTPIGERGSPRARPGGRWRAIAAIAAIVLVAVTALFVLRNLDRDGDPGLARGGLVVVALAPPVRGLPAVPSIEIGPTTETLRLEIDLEGTGLTPGDRLSVRLDGPDATVRHRAEDAVPTLVAGLPALIVDVPAPALQPGRHTLHVHDGRRRVGAFAFDIRGLPTQEPATRKPATQEP